MESCFCERKGVSCGYRFRSVFHCSAIYSLRLSSLLTWRLICWGSPFVRTILVPIVVCVVLVVWIIRCSVGLRVLFLGGYVVRCSLVDFISKLGMKMLLSFGINGIVSSILRWSWVGKSVVVFGVGDVFVRCLYLDLLWMFCRWCFVCYRFDVLSKDCWMPWIGCCYGFEWASMARC